MPALTLSHARSLIEGSLSAARAAGLQPIAVAVLDAGGHDIALVREDGCAFMRADIARGKAWGALAMGLDSVVLGERAEKNPRFFAALAALGQGRIVPNPGGILLRDVEGEVIGAIGISGDQADRDEAAGRSAIAGIGFGEATRG